MQVKTLVDAIQLIKGWLNKRSDKARTSLFECICGSEGVIMQWWGARPVRGQNFEVNFWTAVSRDTALHTVLAGWQTVASERHSIYHQWFRRLNYPTNCPCVCWCQQAQAWQELFSKGSKRGWMVYKSKQESKQHRFSPIKKVWKIRIFVSQNDFCFLFNIFLWERSPHI